MRAPESLAFALAVLVSSLAFAAGEAVELPEGLGLDAPSVPYGHDTARVISN